MTPVLLIGVAFSVLLSVILVVLGIDTSNSAIIGLVGTTISLLLDLMLRVGKMEQKLIAAGGLSREMVKDPQLFSALTSMATDYHKIVEGAPYELFAERAKDVLSECQDNLHNLVEGYMILPPLSQFSFGLKGLSELRRSVKATSYVDAEGFWNSVAGEKYFQANVELLSKDVQIVRDLHRGPGHRRKIQAHHPPPSKSRHASSRRLGRGDPARALRGLSDRG